MIVRARYKVVGTFLLNEAFPITAGGIRVTFEVIDNRVTSILCEWRETNPLSWPSLTTSQSDNTPLISFPSSASLRQSEKLLRTFQGMVSAFQPINVEFTEPHLEWEPETDEERAKLKIFNLKVGKQKNEYPMEFDVIARALLASSGNGDTDVPLNFHRRGRIELDRENYVFAYINYFLMLEHLFGKGKFQKSQLVQSFLDSREFMSALTRGRSHFLRTVRESNPFTELVRNSTEPRAVVEKIVDVRGNLFHNTKRGPAKWSPEEQREFKTETYFISQVAQEIAFELSDAAFSDDITSNYVQQAKANGASFVLTGKYTFLNPDGTETNSEIKFQVIGSTPNNRRVREIIVKAIEAFEERFPAHNLKRLSVHMEDGALLSQLTINA